MRTYTLAMCSAWVTAVIATGQGQALRPPSPVEARRAIVEAFATHDLVAVSDPHGNMQVQAFILSLVRDPGFAAAVDDIVLETASSRYQDAIDRFVRGDDVPRAVLRKAWDEHAVPTSTGVQADELVQAVRDVNRSLTGARKLRLIAGDPPIDWDNVSSAQEHRRWIELRDSYPADLIRRQVLERGRRALVIYGQGHLQRRQIASNYDMSTWQAQTVVSLLERDTAARVFGVWTWLDRGVQLPEAASWAVPSLAVVKETPLGARDFAVYARGMDVGRFAVRDAELVPLPRDQWRTLRMDEQFDAVLYLGDPSSMTFQGTLTALCRDAQYVTERIRRLTMAAPPFEVANFKKACGV